MMDKKGLMKQVAMKALSSLEGLDASNVKAVSIIFQGNKEKGMEEDDEEYPVNSKEESSGECCPDCGCDMTGEEECPECGYEEHTEQGESKSVEGSKKDYEADTPQVRRKEYSQMNQMKGK
jgi:hypothetical protein